MRIKINYIIILLLSSIFFFSCEKDEIGETATASMAGEWYVTATAIDADGNVVFEDADLFGLGHFHLDTYNTADNSTDEMWIDDHGNLWEFKLKVDVDLDNMAFSTNDYEPNTSYESNVLIEDGQILYDAATTPSGSPADSIVFIVSFDDDTYPDAYGYYAYRIAGYRYTGLVGDE